MRILEKKCVGVDANGNLRYYIEASGDSSESEPDETLAGGKIADGSLTFFSNNWTVSSYNENNEAWGDPQEMFG